MIVLDNHARMVEIVQIKWMISTVIVSPGTQGKTVLLVRKITLIFNYFKSLQLVFSSCRLLFSSFLFVVFFMAFTKLMFTFTIDLLNP